MSNDPRAALNRGLQTLSAVVGEKVTFTPPSPGTPYEVPVMWIQDPDRSRKLQGIGAEAYQGKGILRIALADLSSLDCRCTITRTGSPEVWRIEEDVFAPGIGWRIVIGRKSGITAGGR